MTDGHRAAAAPAAADVREIAPRIPDLVADRCVGCLACVNACPDVALHAVALPIADIDGRIDAWAEDADQPRVAADSARARFARTARFADGPARQGAPPAALGIFVDPARCKGCAACVEVCASLGHGALLSIETVADEGSGESTLQRYRRDLAFFATLPPTPASHRHERAAAELVLGEHEPAYRGVAASCAGCGPSTMLRLLATATLHDRATDALGIAVAPGCGVVASWADAFDGSVRREVTSDLTAAIAAARALPATWDATGRPDRRVWVIAGEAALGETGTAALAAHLGSGDDIGVLLLATEVPLGRDVAASALQQVVAGVGTAYVARTTAAHLVHAIHALTDANAYPGPALVVAYTPCQPVHGIPEDAASRQARSAVETRVAPLFSHDPRRGAATTERLSLQGNPGIKEDRVALPDGTPLDPIAFARTEGRFAAHFAKDGRPSSELQAIEAERLAAWRSLQELAGVR